MNIMHVAASILVAFVTATMAAAPVESSRLDISTEVRQLEAKALQNREMIKTIHLSIHHTFVDHRTNVTIGPRAVDEQIETTIDGDRVRENVLRDGATRSIALGDPYLYFYSDAVAEGGRRYGLTMGDWRAYPTIRAEYRPYQPLKLMFYPTWFRNADDVTLNSFLGDAMSRTNIAATRERWRGEDTWRVSYEHSGNRKIEYRLVPRMGYGVVSMVATCPNPDHLFEYAVNATLAEVAPGIWFPSHWRHSFKTDGTPVLDEGLSLQATGVNAPVNPAQFEPISMGVPVNTFVIRSPSKGGEQYKWDGHDVVPITPSQAKVMLFSTASRGLRKVGWGVQWAVGSLLFLAGAAALWKAVRKWRRSIVPTDTAAR